MRVGQNRAHMTHQDGLPVAVAKRDFRRLLEAAEQGQRTVILRHGRPVAEVGPVRTDRPDLPVARRPGGLLALLGALDDWDTMQTDIDAIVAARDAAADRPAPELE
jgi:antitoxin (DNA-binding transcriptional repressor) of toxin-antitoxin stability system